MIDKSKIFIIFSYIFVIYIFLLALIFTFQRSLMYFPVKEKISKSFYKNTKLKIIDISTSDGLILKSLYKKSETNINKTILVFHGNAGHIGHRVSKFKPFMDKGYGLLLLEYRGYGENKGKPTKLGLYRDGEAAINYLINQKIKSKNIIVYGESLGTAIATKLSTNYSFNMTILDAPFTSVADVAQKRYWIFPAKYLVLDAKNHFISPITSNTFFNDKNWLRVNLFVPIKQTPRLCLFFPFTCAPIQNSGLPSSTLPDPPIFWSKARFACAETISPRMLGLSI